MDLGLYARVVWRFRILVGLGLVLALALAFLSYARVSFAGGKVSVRYRQAELWQSRTKLLIQQPGFTAGELTPSGTTAAPSAADSSGSPVVADSGRLAGLSVYYELLANGDAVQNMLSRDPSVHGTMQAQHVTTGGSRGTDLPILEIDGYGATAGKAIHVARRGAEVFRRYLVQLQRRNGIPRSNRVQLSVLNGPDGAVLVTGHKLTLPIVVFVTVLIAALGLSFILENLRPRIHAVPAAHAPVVRELGAREQHGA